MSRFTVKVAKSGQKVAVYEDGKAVEVIEANADTFSPATSMQFAKDLHAELNKDA